MLRENIAHGSWSSEDIKISNFFQRHAGKRVYKFPSANKKQNHTWKWNSEWHTHQSLCCEPDSAEGGFDREFHVGRSLMHVILFRRATKTLLWKMLNNSRGSTRTELSKGWHFYSLQMDPSSVHVLVGFWITRQNVRTQVNSMYKKESFSFCIRLTLVQKISLCIDSVGAVFCVMSTLYFYSCVQ